VTLSDVEIDLDRFPFLTWKQKVRSQPRNGVEWCLDSPGTYAVRVQDQESGTELLLEEAYGPPWDRYRAFNLRELFSMKGVHTFRLKYYYLGVQPIEKKSLTAAPGDYIVLDFVRAEAE
jgi:hypothetical protein